MAKLVLDNIFGRRLGTVLEEGLADSSDSDDFQLKLESLLQKWRNFTTPSSADMEAFLQWFVDNKVHVIRDTMLR